MMTTLTQPGRVKMTTGLNGSTRRCPREFDDQNGQYIPWLDDQPLRTHGFCVFCEVILAWMRRLELSDQRFRRRKHRLVSVDLVPTISLQKSVSHRGAHWLRQRTVMGDTQISDGKT